MEEGILLLQRLLDLDHHLDSSPDIRRLVRHGGTRIDIFLVHKAGTEAGSFFDHNLMTR